MTARERLNVALLTMAERGTLTPCQGRRRRDRWTSDDHADREWAANVCTSLACPVLDACRDTGAEEKHGVWGGVDVTPTSRKRGAA